MLEAILQNAEFLHGKPTLQARFRQQPEDFQVVEQLEVGDHEEGEHQWLWVYKKGANTTFVAGQLAAFAGVSERDVSYSGLKDRHAETWQWFSIQLPGKSMLDWQQLEHPEFRIERAVKQSKKLKSGYHRGNQFCLTLRDVSDVVALQQRWQLLCEQGVPNYFGEQRFGHNGQNLSKGIAFVTGEMSGKQRKKIRRPQQSLLLSAVRSAIFNAIVSSRIQTQRMQPELHDFMLLAGSRSFFQVEAVDDALLARWRSGDIELSAPLAGGWREPWQEHLSPFEHDQLQHYEAILAGLKRQRVDLGRRAVLLRPQETTFTEINADTVELKFTLKRGSFATSVLRELFAPLENKVNQDDEIIGQ